MSGYITNAGENYLLDLLTGRRSPLPTYYLALILDKQPSKFISGSELDEPLVPEYSRAAYENSTLFWTASAGEIHSTVECAFPAAESVWGTCKYWAVCDSAAGGDVLWAGPMAVPLLVEIDDVLVLEPGSITLRVTSYTARVSL